MFPLYKSKAQIWFPTTIFEANLEDEHYKIINDEILGGLKEYLNNPSYKKATYINTKTNLHKLKKFEKMTFFFNKIIFDYLKFLKLEHHEFEISGCWANISRINYSHHNHSHQNNFVSGVYYVQTEEGKSDKIHFNDPREQNKVLVPVPSEQTIYNSNGALLDARVGRAYLFPSWLRHEVPINKSNKERISVAFNAMFKNLENMSKPGFDEAIKN